MNKLTLFSKALVITCFFIVQASATEHIPEFKKAVLSTTFISEGVCVGDVNHDGKKDVMAGAFWFEAPKWTKHLISDDDIRYDKSLIAFPKSHVFKVDEGYSNSFLNFAQDVNHDGWVDLIKVGLPGEAVYWFENPKNKPILWERHFLYASIGNESPLFEDVNGDGLKDIIGNDSKSKQMIWLEAPRAKKDTTWEAHVISSNPNLGTHKYTHGLGYGDMNGDGRKDIVFKEGWWECPADMMTSEWIFHPLALQFDSAQIMLLDLDGDGLIDLLNSSAHDYGIWWHRRTPTGVETQLIQNDLSQTHAMAMADFNGDKHPDFVVGKRFMAHNGKDPGEFEKPILRWLEFKPGKSPMWISHDIDEDSGAGIHIVIDDMNRDGLNDIIISNKKGVFIFYHYNKQTNLQTPKELVADNGKLTVKFDLTRGGAISWISNSGSQRSLVNIADEGRYIQQSYYAGKSLDRKAEGQSPAWSPWAWNPIQVGDAFRNRAKILDYKQSKDTLYVKCIPMQWDMNNRPAEAEMEQWTFLNGNTLTIRNRLTCHRTDEVYGDSLMRNQELPAVYPISALKNLFTYEGNAPFTNAPYKKLEVKNLASGFWGRYKDVSENWMAFVDDAGVGMLVYNPQCTMFLAGMAGEPGKEATSSSTSYIAPIKDEILYKNSVYDYEYYILIGSLAEMREQVYEIKKNLK